MARSVECHVIQGGPHTLWWAALHSRQRYVDTLIPSIAHDLDVLGCRWGHHSGIRSSTTAILCTQTRTEGGLCERYQEWHVKLSEPWSHEPGNIWGHQKPGETLERILTDFQPPEQHVSYCTLLRQSQETNSPHQSWPCFPDYLAVESVHSFLHRLPQMALAVNHLPFLPFELLLNTKSYANYSHLPPFINECSKTLTLE